MRLHDLRADGIVAPIHQKAMPVILTRQEEVETWLTAPWEYAKALQRPLPDEMLTIVDAPPLPEDGTGICPGILAVSDSPNGPEAPSSVTPAGIVEHYCEHPDCTAWGGFGFSRSKDQPSKWFCREHRSAGERYIGRA